MNKLILCLALLVSSAVWGQTYTYSNLDASTAVDNGSGIGWGSCVTCAGGGSNATISTSPFQTQPSVDGASRDFYISGATYTNGLWWYKVGPNDAVSHFKSDFWVYFNSGTQHAQALEFDTFQFIAGQEYMFGTQCDYASGTWDVWNMGAHAWVHSAVACPRFKFNTWYHLTWTFHRTSPDNHEHYDSLTVVQHTSSGKVASNNTYKFDMAFPSGPTPAGWSDNLGVQFQMDIGATGASMEEWVDEVTLTAW
jgi:diadenosine tetraphosphatase ApaH/serine/threonine PP2A family protein phosphatase